MILVTGATGKVGGELVRLLAADGYKVRAAVRTPDKARNMVWCNNEHIQIVRFDYTVPDTFAKALAGVERMFMLTLTMSSSLELVKTMVDQAKQAGVRQIVTLSGMRASHDKTLPSRQLEDYIADSGIAFTFLRPNWFMQNFQSPMMRSLTTEGRILQPAGDAKISYIDTRDIAAVAATALTDTRHEHQAYTLTGGQALDHYEIADIFSQVLGKQITYVPLSEDEMRQMMQQAGTPEKATEMLLRLYQGARQGSSAPVSPAVAQVLGRQPITFAQYVRDHF
jgi:uncharacterized protein YbjT (DUF2867 family)